MSAVRALADTYARLDALNRSLIRSLEEGASLESLEAAFLEKASLLGKLSVPSDSAFWGGAEAVPEALARQAEAARSEARLAEALGKRRQELDRARDAGSAYRRNLVDNSLQKRLDLGT